MADEEVAGPPTLVTNTLMEDAQARAGLARETVEFAASLRRS